MQTRFLLRGWGKLTPRVLPRSGLNASNDLVHTNVLPTLAYYVRALLLRHAGSRISHNLLVTMCPPIVEVSGRSSVAEYLE